MVFDKKAIVGPVGSTSALPGDSPELLKPFLEHFQAARVAMQEEMGKEPGPGGQGLKVS